MKYFKKIFLVSGIFFVVLILIIKIVRLPSYTIKTSGKLYVVNKLSRDITVFDLKTGKEVKTIPTNILTFEATSYKDKIFLTDFESSKGHNIYVIDSKKNTVQQKISLEKNTKLNGIAKIPNTNKLALTDYINNNLLIYNIENDSLENQIPTEQNKSILTALHPKKPIAYVANINSGTISVIDLQLQKVVKIIVCGIGRKGIDITPDGSEIWVTNSKENSIIVINTTTLTITDKIQSDNESLKLTFSLDGNYCWVTNETEGTISVFNQQTKKNIKTIYLRGKTTFFERILYHTPRPVNILMHPNGLYAFVANSNADIIEVIDIKTFQIVSTIATGRVPEAMVFLK